MLDGFGVVNAISFITQEIGVIIYIVYFRRTVMFLLQEVQTVCNGGNLYVGLFNYIIVVFDEEIGV